MLCLCRSSQEEARDLWQALQASAEALESATQDAAAHEDAAGDLIEELDQARAERSAIDNQLTEAKVK